MGWMLVACLGIAAGTAFAASTPAHRHRLVGLAAKGILMHASVLYHESAPGRQLDRDLARQNVSEMTRLTDSQIANLRALETDPDNEPAAREVVEMSALAARARAQTDSVVVALGASDGGQMQAHRRAQLLFHLERQLLQLHQEAEARLGIKPPPDPPPLAPPAR